MTQLIQSVPFLFVGLISVTIVDVAGALASKRFQFNYGILAFLSFFIYGSIGYIVSKELSLNIAFLVSLVIAFYDATIGWKLSKRIKPQTGLTEEQLSKITVTSNLTVTLVCAFIFTYLGYLVSWYEDLVNYYCVEATSPVLSRILNSCLDLKSRTGIPSPY